MKKQRTKQSETITLWFLVVVLLVFRWGGSWGWGRGLQGGWGWVQTGSRLWAFCPACLLTPPAGRRVGDLWECQECRGRRPAPQGCCPLSQTRTAAAVWALRGREGSGRMDGRKKRWMNEWQESQKLLKSKKKNVCTLYRDLTQTSEPGSDEALPGKSTVRASWTACLSRLSRANIQWGFTCCCFNTFFTCAQSRKFNVSVRKSCVSLNLLTRGMSVLTLKWSNLLHLGSWTAPPAGCSVTLRRREVRLGAPAGYWSAASCPGSGCFLSSS